MTITPRRTDRKAIKTYRITKCSLVESILWLSKGASFSESGDKRMFFSVDSSFAYEELLFNAEYDGPRVGKRSD